MGELEAPTEQLEEQVHHHVEHGGGHGKEGWAAWVALSSALLAVFAAVTAMLGNHHANEMMIEQIQASDQWAYYQAKGIKGSVLSAKIELLEAFGKSVTDKDRGKIDEYKKDQEKIFAEAKEKEHKSSIHLAHHVVYARGVTMFQVAIGVAAIAILTRRRKFWFVGLGFGLIGLTFLIQGLLLPH